MTKYIVRIRKQDGTKTYLVIGERNITMETTDRRLATTFPTALAAYQEKKNRFIKKKAWVESYEEPSMEEQIMQHLIKNRFDRCFLSNNTKECLQLINIAVDYGYTDLAVSMEQDMFYESPETV